MSEQTLSTASFQNLFHPEILKRKYAEITDPFFRRRIEHLIWISRHGDEFRSYMLENLGVVSEGIVRPMLRPGETAYPFLAYLLTGETGFAESGRRRLFELASSVTEREKTDNVQMHCWCDAFPFGRWLMLADAVWDSPVFSAADREFLQERFLYYLWAHPFQRLKARALEGTPCNNQNAAMAVACVAGGHLFGQKHARDPHALEMLHLGLPHLQKFLTAFPSDGYSMEGSTYMGGVNALIIPLALELIRASTGEDLFDCSESGDCATPRETLESVMRLSSPSGLLHPWDNYGYSRANFTPAAAYLAMRTGDFRPLRFLEGIGALELPGHFGWGFDKTLWTLLWMLQAEAAAEENGAWSFDFQQPSLNAAAAGPQNRLFALQMWDQNHFPPFRAHFNPNALVMEYDGSPLLLDGCCVEIAKASEFKKEKYQFYKADTDKMLSLGGAVVGAHNTVFFDGDEHYFPQRSTEGKLVFHRREGDLCLFESDVTDCFTDGYDVLSVRRACLVIGDDAVLVRDRIVSRTARAITWRAHVREGETKLGNGYFSVLTQDRTRLEVCIPHGIIEHRHWPGSDDGNALSHPGRLEGSCHEVSHHAHGCEATLHTLLVASAALVPWFPLRSGWKWQVADEESEIEALRRDWSSARPIDFSSHSWFYTTEHHEPGIGLYRCEFDLSRELPESLWLQLPRLIRSSTFWINGRRFEVPVAANDPPLPWHRTRIDAALRPGKNIIEIAAPSTLEAGLRGEILLLKPVPENNPAFLIQTGAPGHDRLELHHHGTVDIVEWQEEACVVKRKDGRVTRIPLDPSAPPPRRPRHPVPPLRLPGPNNADGDPGALLASLADADWRVVLSALERAEGTTDRDVLQAVWNLLQREIQTHETSPRRRPDDLCWYRLKAAAIRVLGDARFEPVAGLLGEQLLDTHVFYPVRVASAEALGRIGVPGATEYLRRVPEYDEHNTRLTAARAFANASRNGSAPVVHSP